IPALTDIETSMQAAQPVVGIRVNRDLASEAGISLQQIGSVLQPMLSGEEVSEWTSSQEETYKLVVRLPEGERSNVEALANLPISRTQTSVIRLSDIADIAMTSGPAEINRQDRSRGATVEANISGANIGEVMGEVQAAIDSIELPAGYRMGMGGDAEQLGEIGSSAGSALLLA